MAAERRLMVDWPACKGHGLCAELVPELVTLDEWGYPIVADRPVTRGVQAHAQRAVAACPTLALLLVEQTNQATPARPAADDPISGAIRAVTGSNPVQRRPEKAEEPERAERSSRRERSGRSERTGRLERVARAQPSSSSPEAEEDPITGAIRAVTGPNAASRRTPPTGMIRHGTPAYGQSALVPEDEPDEPGQTFLTGHEPRDPYARPPADPYARPQVDPYERPQADPPVSNPPAQPVPPAPPTPPASSPRRLARQAEQAGRPRPEDQPGHQPRTRREARARRQ